MKPAAVLAFLLITGMSQADELPEGSQQAIDRCRAIFADVALNPGAIGGWLDDFVARRHVLCLYGTLEAADVSSLGMPPTPQSFDLLIVRSAGGPVEQWLAVAERLIGRVSNVVVDEACFSSCANYALPVGGKAHAVPGSLVVWHGGPAGDNEGLESIDQIIDYDALTARTLALYEELGVDADILLDTSRPPPAEKLDSDSSGPVSGYALSPERLARCYGFANLEGLWHAGDDAAVAALGLRRSKALRLLESPFTAAADCGESTQPKRFPPPR